MRATLVSPLVVALRSVCRATGLDRSGSAAAHAAAPTRGWRRRDHVPQHRIAEHDVVGLVASSVAELEAMHAAKRARMPAR